MRSSPRAEKYPDLDEIYSQCSGPGALRTAEFVADKMGLRPEMRVLDIGIYRGVSDVLSRQRIRVLHGGRRSLGGRLRPRW